MSRLRILSLLLAATLLMGVQGAVRVKQPIAQGVWYPEDPEALKQKVDRLIDESDVQVPEGGCFALVMPHAPYESFGSIAAAAAKMIPKNGFDRVVVLAASHFSSFRGCSIPSVQIYRTPLGDVVVDDPVCRLLDRSMLIDVRSVQYRQSLERRQVHEREYTTEVVLPFLQERLKAFTLVPLLVGDFVDSQGRMDDNAVKGVAKEIREVLTDRTLLVVSTDFTHFGDKFNYRPFRENILQGIEAFDRGAFDCIIKKDYEGFKKYLEKTDNKICGKTALALLLNILPKNAEGTLLKYEISAKRTGDTKSSISYASLAFFVPPGGGTP